MTDTLCDQRVATSCVVCSRARPRVEDVEGAEVRYCTPRCRHHRVSDGWFVCPKCQDKIAGQLRELPELYALLGGILEPGASVPDGSRHTKVHAAPLPVRLGPLNLRQRGGMVDILASWEADWREHFGLTAPTFQGSTEQTLIAVVRFLHGHLPRACQTHPAVDEFAREVRELHTACKATLGDVEREFSPGRCPVPVEDDRGEATPCGGRLTTDLYGMGDVSCRDCGASWPRERLLHLGRQLEEETA